MTVRTILACDVREGDSLFTGHDTPDVLVTGVTFDRDKPTMTLYLPGGPCCLDRYATVQTVTYGAR